MAEMWKPITEDPRYEVSNFGRVRSFCRFGGPHILASARASHGYPTVVLGRKIGSKMIHILVAEYFIGPKPFIGAEVLHKDGDKSNASESNLEWGTRSKNNQDRKWQMAKTPEDYHPLTGERAAELKRRISGRNGSTLAREFGVSPSLVSAIRHGKVHADA